MAGLVSEDRLQVLQIYRLFQFVHAHNYKQIKKLVQRGVYDLINITEPCEGKAILHVAAAANDIDMVEFLTSHGARPDVQDMLGHTSVMLAAELGHDNVVALLAKRNADMKLTDIEGKGVLFYCLCPTNRHKRCLQVALNYRADVNNVSHAGIAVFLQACENAKECEDMCLSLLERGANPNAINQVTGHTALMGAVRAGAINLVRAILKRGANVNALDSKKLCAIHFAADGGFFEIIQVLSAYAADMGVIAENGNTALHYAARGGYADCCRFLAQRGCNPKLKNMEGLLPRHIAKNLGHKASLEELKTAERLYGKLSKVPASTTEPWALTLHDWSYENKAELLKAFELTSDGIINIEVVSWDIFASVLQDLRAPVDNEQVQQILFAHDKQREGLINLNEFFSGVKYVSRSYVIESSRLKKKKKPSRARNATKKSKLNLPMPICFIPSRSGGPPNVMIETYSLVTDPNRFDQDHPPAHPIEDDSAWYIDEPEKIYMNISYCVRTGDIESLKLAFSQKVPVDVKDRFFKTPLMTACASGNYKVAKFLLGVGADVNARDQFCWTPLHHACYAGQLNIIKLLVEAGAAVNMPSLYGATPLMRAIESSKPFCVEYLLKAGASVTAKNKAEQSCLDIAHAFADIRTVKLIQARINSISKLKNRQKRQPNTDRDNGAKAQVKPKLATSTSSKEKEPVPTLQVSEYFAASAGKMEAQMNSLIILNTRITSGALNKVDISFVPRMTWGSQLVESKEKRRQSFTYEVDFDDIKKSPLSKNIQRKTSELMTSLSENLKQD